LWFLNSFDIIFEDLLLKDLSSKLFEYFLKKRELEWDCINIPFCLLSSLCTSIRQTQANSAQDNLLCTIICRPTRHALISFRMKWIAHIQCCKHYVELMHWTRHTTIDSAYSFPNAGIRTMKQYKVYIWQLSHLMYWCIVLTMNI
jgi:hypothetical protein